jgi:hypothetical protein
LVQWDTSVHDWLEGRGPRLYLVAMIDDATSRTYGRFVEQDSTEENLRVLWGYLERWGRPVEFYTDKSSLFTVNRPRVEAADEAVKQEGTQIGRALQELGIGWIAAHSPQAKGRVERFFGTAQDRLVKGRRLAWKRRRPTWSRSTCRSGTSASPGWRRAAPLRIGRCAPSINWRQS